MEKSITVLVERKLRHHENLRERRLRRPFRYSNASNGSKDEENTLFRAVAESRTSEEFCRTWLDLQCKLIPQVSAAVLVLGDAESKQFAPAATWPPKKPIGGGLAQAAEQALAESDGAVFKTRENQRIIVKLPNDL